MSDNMIERVAFAIEATMFAPHELPLDAELHGKYRETARAAIEAIREPGLAKTARQVADQCCVIAYLARQIAIVHEQKVQLYSETNLAPDFVDFVGHETADLMETLGNILNAMDAVDKKEDAWCAPIFELAHANWPRPR